MIEVLVLYKNVGGDREFLHNLVFIFPVENGLHEKSESIEYNWLLNKNYWDDLDIIDRGHSKDDVSQFCLYLGYPWTNNGIVASKKNVISSDLENLRQDHYSQNHFISAITRPILTKLL